LVSPDRDGSKASPLSRGHNDYRIAWRGRRPELPLYFFVIKFPEGEHDDLNGALFASDASARSYAERVIRELNADGDYESSGLNMVVKDAEGRTVFAIPF
jgi:hypothetical protein